MREVAQRAVSRPWQGDQFIQDDGAFLDQNNAISQNHSLCHVMGHQQGGEAFLAPNPLDQGVHLDSGQGIQGTQRLVQQQKTGAMNQGAGQGDALTLSAG